MGRSLAERVNSGSLEYFGVLLCADSYTQKLPSMPVCMPGLLWNPEENQAKVVIIMYLDLGLALVQDNMVKIHDIK